AGAVDVEPRFGADGEAADGGREVAFVGAADEVVLEAEGADDFRGAGDQRDDAHGLLPPLSFPRGAWEREVYHTNPHRRRSSHSSDKNPTKRSINPSQNHDHNQFLLFQSGHAVTFGLCCSSGCAPSSCRNFGKSSGRRNWPPPVAASRFKKSWSAARRAISASSWYTTKRAVASPPTSWPSTSLPLPVTTRRYSPGASLFQKPPRSSFLSAATGTGVSPPDGAITFASKRPSFTSTPLLPRRPVLKPSLLPAGNRRMSGFTQTLPSCSSCFAS